MWRVLFGILLGLVLLQTSLHASARETLIVLNKEGHSAWLVDPITGDVRSKIRVGEGPHEAATSPDGRTAVVCNYGGQSNGKTLTVIDVPSGTVTRSIDLSPYRRPHGIRYLDSQHVLLTSESSHKLLKVDIPRGAVVATYRAGGDVHLLDCTDDRKTAYATAISSGILCRIDLETPAADPTTLSLGSGTEALALRPGGSEIWVGNNNEQVVRVVDAHSFQVVSEITCGVQPIRIAFTPDGGHALVSCLLSGDLAVIDANSRTIVQRIALAKFVAPMHMWKDTNHEEQRALVQRVIAEGARPLGVLVDPRGDAVYVAARGQDFIAVIDPRNWTVVRKLPAGKGPDGMAWSSVNASSQHGQ